MLSPESNDDAEYFVHAMKHQKHLNRLLEEVGVERVLRSDEETPWTHCPELEARTICMIHLQHGCPCRARWRCIPRGYANVLGGKVSMARLFRAYKLNHLCPTTYISLQEYTERHEAEEDGQIVKWFVKVSHGNSRKGMICATCPDDIAAHVSTFPRNFRYVIQREVDNPLLIDGYKALLRLWVLMTVHQDGSVGLHFSRRLRVNRLQSKYDAEDPSPKGDMCHHPPNIFDDSSTWAHYPVYWHSCVEVAELILRTMLDRWRTRPSLHPPLILRPDGGMYNIFAMDYVPNTKGESVLIETNVDPGFKNKCSETILAAHDFVDFFFNPIVKEGHISLPDKRFRSVMLDAEEGMGPEGVIVTDEDSEEEEESEDTP